MPTPKEDPRASGRKTSVGEVLAAIRDAQATARGDRSFPQAGRSTATRSQDEHGEAFKARFSALLQEIQEAAQSGSAWIEQAKGVARQAGVLAAKEDWPAAGALLNQVRAMLDQAIRVESPAMQVDFEGMGDGQPVPRVANMMAIWVGAKQRVMTQVEALQTACADFDDEGLQAVADAELLCGIEGAEEDLEEALIAGVGIDQAIDDMRSAIETDSEIRALDDNPMDVPVNIAKTLLGALRQMASVHGSA